MDQGWIGRTPPAQLLRLWCLCSGPQTCSSTPGSCALLGSESRRPSQSRPLLQLHILPGKRSTGPSWLGGGGSLCFLLFRFESKEPPHPRFSQARVNLTLKRRAIRKHRFPSPHVAGNEIQVRGGGPSWAAEPGPGQPGLHLTTLGPTVAARGRPLFLQPEPWPPLGA